MDCGRIYDTQIAVGVKGGPCEIESAAFCEAETWGSQEVKRAILYGRGDWNGMTWRLKRDALVGMLAETWGSQEVKTGDLIWQK